MTPLSLINPLVCPPDGFRYVFSEDGYLVHAWTFTDWIQLATNHLLANDVPVPPDLAGQMQTQLCRTLPPGWCNFDDPLRPRVSTSLDWSAVQQGLATFTRWFLSKKTVPPQEAERRALVCSRCYLNVQIQGCAGCQRVVEEVVKGHATKYDFALRGCAVCKCVLKAKVHVPQEILDRENTKLQDLYPDFCWLKKGGDNYRA